MKVDCHPGLGEKDYVKQVACRIGGQVQYGRVFLKPGKPTTLLTFPEPARARVMLALPGTIQYRLSAFTSRS